MIMGIGLPAGWTALPRQFIPALVTLGLLLVQLLPWTYSAYAMIPSLVFMSIFYWSLRAPGLCPPLLAFACGTLADLSELTPLGSQAVIFLGLVMYMGRRPKAGDQSFLRLWVLFSAFCLAANIALWLLEIIAGASILPLAQVLARTAVAIAVFPLVARLILKPAERLMTGREDG